MKKQFLTTLLVLLNLILAACSAGPLGPTPPRTPTLLPPTPLTVTCADRALLNRGDYRAENNTWGKGNLQGWTQCLGLEANPDGTVMGRWTWEWPSADDNVKAYPEIIFGRKPGGTTTTASLPKEISAIQALTVTYELTSIHTGSGNLAFDIWLTDTPIPATWGVPPISHEIMIWLEGYGNLHPGGQWREQVNIDGLLYDLYVGENFGAGWRYLAFVSTPSQLGVGALDLVSFLAYLQTNQLVTGAEYVASIEFGNEIVEGVGETVLKSYAVTVR